MLTVLRDAGDMDEARLLASRMARQIAEEDVWANERIGDHGVELIRDLSKQTAACQYPYPL